MLFLSDHKLMMSRLVLGCCFVLMTSSVTSAKNLIPLRGVVRLVQGANSCSGRLEVKSGQFWHHVCENYFSSQNALVACRELGCGFPGAYYGRQMNESTISTTWSAHFVCSGHEERLEDCPASTIPSETIETNCTATLLHCTKQPPAPSLTLSSMKGQMKDPYALVYEGHGFVVTCSVDLPYKVHSFRLRVSGLEEQLSEWSQAAVENSAHFMFPAATKLYSRVQSYQCDYNFDFSSQNFSTSSDLVVSVLDASYVRLVDERSRCMGRLEVENLEKWRPVSQHQPWSLTDTAVVCRQLNCGSAVQNQLMVHEELPVWHFYSDCNGSESALLDCGTVKDWTSTSTVQMFCSDILHPPNISLVIEKGSIKKVSMVVYVPYPFFVNCSVQPQFPGGHFSLVFTGLNNKTVIMNQTAIDHSAIFNFNVAHKNHTGNYSCVYYKTVVDHEFSSQSQTLAVVAEDTDDVQLDDGGNTPVCNGTLFIRDGKDRKMVTSKLWGMRHASIVCRNVGCGKALSTLKIHFNSTKSMWRFFSDCDGSETALLGCGDIVVTCFSSTAVRVVCNNKA